MALNTASRNNFLDRFSGKIGFITKHGDLINPKSLGETRKPMIRYQNSCSLHFQQNKLFPPIRDNGRQKLDLSMTMQRRQTESLYSKHLKQSKFNAKTSSGTRKVEQKQKLTSIGANILNMRNDENTQYLSDSKFVWRKDIESKQQHRGLAGLQLSKATSFKNNPLVHL